jgi:hypothetical protein
MLCLVLSAASTFIWNAPNRAQAFDRYLTSDLLYKSRVTHGSVDNPN